MNRRNSAYLVILLLLLLIAGYFIWKEKRTPHLPADQAFGTENTSDIEKVLITDAKGGKVKLVRDGKSWKLNDTATAMPVKIDFLMTTLSTMKMEYPVSSADKIKARIFKKFTKVEVYNHQQGAPDKIIYIGEVVSEGLGNYAVLEYNGKREDKPYIIEIPGFVGDIGARFFTNARDWSDLKVFDSNMDAIKEVTVVYPFHPLSSFRLIPLGKDTAKIEQVAGKSDTVTTGDRKIDDEWNKAKKQLNMVKVHDYLNSFTYINAEAYDNEYYGKDTITNKKPLAKIYLNLKSGETDSIIIFMMPTNQRTKTELPNGETPPYDLDRYFAQIHGNKDFVVIQQFVFGKILRQYYDFYNVKQ